jgi:hypothetical protein
MMNGVLKRVLAAVVFASVAWPAAAQTPPAAASGTTNVEVDPIRCWWRTGAGAVRIGETFDLSLTCAPLENEAVQVFVDESRLGSSVIQLPPFEVVSGSHPADLRSGSRRFFQYQYTLRVINPDVIGKDVRLPDVQIHYRINSRVSGNAALQGRDLVYVMPSQSIRVLSMVPTDAGDIRDQLGENFANSETLQFRASALEIVAATAVALGSLMVLIVLVRMARGSRKRTPADERLISSSTIVSAARAELGRIERQRGAEGWTDALAARALAATRVVAAYAVGRAASQRLDKDATAGEGRLVVKPTLGGKARVISSPVTASHLRRAATLPGRHVVSAALDPLAEALTTFAAVQYGRDAAPDQTALDAALSSAMAAAGPVKRRYYWLRELVGRKRRPQSPVASRA